MLATLAPIDWMNAVFVAGAMSIIAGVPLAIYTGVVMARFTAFDQARMGAVKALGSLYRLCFARTDLEVLDVKATVNAELACWGIEAVRIRQGRLQSVIAHVMARAVEIDHRKVIAQGIAEGITDTAVLGERVRVYLAMESNVLAHMVFELKPQLWPLIKCNRMIGPDEPVRFQHQQPLTEREAEIRKEHQRNREPKGS